MIDLSGARVVVTGGAGFVGSHLCDALVAADASVVVLDNLCTGRRVNLAAIADRVTLIVHDVTEHIVVDGAVDAVLHLASPASPVDYLRYPIQTLKVGSLGTHNALGLAMSKDARFLLASTSEVYGSPEVHPQPESYWGHVNPVGPRGVYDEAKRFAEALTLAYHREHGVDVRIARIFNTYGPRMRTEDGRVVPAFLAAADAGVPLAIHGDGKQTRTLCYVEDLVRGLLALLLADGVHQPVNLGGDDELSMNELAALVQELVGSTSSVTHVASMVDDPQRRCPDLTRAQTVLGFEPRVSTRDGLARTLAWLRDRAG